jgi:hypothetical protein
MTVRMAFVRPRRRPAVGPRRSGAKAAAVAALLGCACSEFNVRGQDETEQEAVQVEETAIQDELAQVDVLWVVDDTASMAQEQAALGQALADFAAALEAAAVGWQVGVTSTSLEGDEAGLLRGDPWIMTPATPELAAALARAAAVGTAGSPPEAGLGAAVLALSEPLRSEGNRGFRRPDAALHVVVLSDADDDSASLLGDDPAGAFLAVLDDEAASSGQDALFSAVVGPTPSGCTGAGGTAAPASIYAAVAEASGGVVQSICEADLSPVADAVADSSQVWPTVFPLQATPVAGSLRVAVDGQRLDEGWSEESDPPAVRFQSPPAPGAELRFSYEVAP